jgi:hypothetical protein
MMNDRLKAIAPYVSIFGLFVLLSSLVAPNLASQRGVAAPEWLDQALAISGAVLLLAWPIFRPEDLRGLFGSRRARFGGNALILTIAFISILAVVNFFGTRVFRTFDLTSNKQFSISSKTVQILEGLESQGRAVKVTAVLGAAEANQKREFERLSEQYKQRFAGADFEVIDPQVDIIALNALAQRTGSNPGNSVLVAESGEPGSPAYKHALVYSSFDEQAITEAIVKATRDVQKTIAFTAGHGEYSLEPPSASAQQGRSYSGIKSALEREGYAVETLNLVAGITDTIQADILVIAGPTITFRDEEISALSDFVEGGGGILMMVDPPQEGVSTDAGLNALLAPWGLRLRDDIALDEARAFMGRSPAIPAVFGDGYRFHTITKDLVGSGNATVFAGARSIAVGDSPIEGVTVTPLFDTSSGSWGETDLGNAEAKQDGEDVAGPLSLGAAIELAGAGAAKGGRVVVFGSAQMASDGLLQQLQLAALVGGGVMNGDVVLNSANWLAQDELLIGIEPTPPDQHPINPPQNPLLLFLATVLLVPMAVAAVGFWIWWGRR